MENIMMLIATSILIERLVEYAKKIKENPVLITTMLLGIGISFVFNKGLFNSIGVEINYYADLVLTGILMSGGSNYFSDFIGKYTGKNVTRIETTEIIEDNTSQQ